MTNAPMQLLEQHGVPTHFVRELNDRETLKSLYCTSGGHSPKPGFFAKRYEVEEGIAFDRSTINTKEKLDKNRFHRDMGGAEEAYAEVMKRLYDYI